MESSQMILTEGIKVLALNTSIALKSLLEGTEEETINEISILLADIFYEFEKCSRERENYYEQLQYSLEDNKQLLNQYNVEKNLRNASDNKLIEVEFKYSDVRFSLDDQLLVYNDLKQNYDTKMNYYIRRDQTSAENYFNLKTDYDNLLQDHHRLRSLYLSQITIDDETLPSLNYSKVKTSTRDFRENLMEAEMDFEEELEEPKDVEYAGEKFPSHDTVVEESFQEEKENILDFSMERMVREVGKLKKESKVEDSSSLSAVGASLWGRVEFVDDSFSGDGENTLESGTASDGHGNASQSLSGEGVFRMEDSGSDSARHSAREAGEVTHSDSWSGLGSAVPGEGTPTQAGSIKGEPQSQTALKEDSSLQRVKEESSPSEASSKEDLPPSQAPFQKGLPPSQDALHDSSLSQVTLKEESASSQSGLKHDSLPPQNAFNEGSSTSQGTPKDDSPSSQATLKKASYSQAALTEDMPTSRNALKESSFSQETHAEESFSSQPAVNTSSDSQLPLKEVSSSSQDALKESSSQETRTEDLPSSQDVLKMSSSSQPTLKEETPSPKTTLKKESPSQDTLKEKSPSPQTPLKEASPSQPTLKEKSPSSRTQLKESSPSRPTHREKSPSPQTPLKESPSPQVTANVAQPKGPTTANRPPPPRRSKMTRTTAVKSGPSFKFTDLGINFGNSSAQADKGNLPATKPSPKPMTHASPNLSSLPSTKVSEVQPVKSSEPRQAAQILAPPLHQARPSPTDSPRKPYQVKTDSPKKTKDASVVDSPKKTKDASVVDSPKKTSQTVPKEASPPTAPPREGSIAAGKVGPDKALISDIRSETEKILQENQNLRDSCNALTTINRELKSQLESMAGENQVINHRVRALETANAEAKLTLRDLTLHVSEINREKVELAKKCVHMEDSAFTETDLVSVMESRNHYKKMFLDLKEYMNATDEARRKNRTVIGNIFKRSIRGREETGETQWNIVRQTVVPQIFHPLRGLEAAERPVSSVITAVSEGPVYTKTGLKIVGTSIFYPTSQGSSGKFEDNTLRLSQMDDRLATYHRVVASSRLGLEGAVSPRLWMSSSGGSTTAVSVIDVNQPDSPLDSFDLEGHVLTLASIPGLGFKRSCSEDVQYEPGVPEDDYFPYEFEICNIALCDAIKRFGTILPTIWAGCQNGSLSVLPSIAEFSSPLMRLKLTSSIKCIKHVARRVFVGTHHSGLACFSRGGDNQWSPDYETLIECFDGNVIGTISTMVAVGDIILWVACRNRIFMVDCVRLVCYNSHELDGEHVDSMAWSGDGVWASFAFSPDIRLYHFQTCAVVQVVNVTNIIPKNIILSMPIGQAQTVSYPTSLKILGNMLWLGHSTGVVVGFRLLTGGKQSYTTGEAKQHRVYKHGEIVLPSTYMPNVDANDPFILPVAHKSAVVGLNGVCNADGNIDCKGNVKMDSIRVVSCGNGIRDDGFSRGIQGSNSVALATWNWNLISTQNKL